MPSQIPSAPAPPAHIADVGILPGIGAVRRRSLIAAGIATVWDVLHALPGLAAAPPPVCEEGGLPAGMAVRLRAQVRAVRPSFRGRRGRALEVQLQRHDGTLLRARFFNAAYLAKRLAVESWYLWEGRLDEQGRMLLHPRFQALAGATSPIIEPAGVAVRYDPQGGISSDGWAVLVAKAAEHYLATITDPLGEMAAEAYQELLMQAHRPRGEDEYRAARRELARRELRALAWRLQQLAPSAADTPGHPWRWDAADELSHRALLPYALTAGQDQALADIRHDMRQSSAMCRLLQGEVGSGKTALAMMACLAVVVDGAQAFVLAPTSLLAVQHHQFFSARLRGTRWCCELLTAQQTGDEREQLLARVRSGEVSILIGTHSLLDAEIVVTALGLLVIDEQHRFGVAQRLAVVATSHLRQGWRPDLLLLSATPIPRTLALTIYGGMAMTQLRGSPPGRHAVRTTFQHLPDVEADIPRLVQEALAEGGQVFVVCARKHVSDSGAAASDVHRLLSRHLAGTTAVALLHGDLEPQEKRDAMDAVLSGRARVLVSTTLIEVGIDVPQATHLLVVDAERLGLAQLHQLRGRIGRGSLPGQCLLCYGSGLGPDVQIPPPPQRLQLLCQTSDGLEIAEADLAERGPGNLLGTLQHGAFELRIADLASDLDLLHSAHEVVRAARARGEHAPEDLARLLRMGNLGIMTP